MNIYFRAILLTLCTFVLFITVSSAQSITIDHVNNGSYSAGSTIAVKLNATGVCLGRTNVFTLYLSDASGSFATKTEIGRFEGFYTTFVNGVLPTAITPGSGYRLQVSSSAPAANSNIIPLTVVAGAKVTAGVTVTPINPAAPDVIGGCNGNLNNFSFNNDASQVNNAPLGAGDAANILVIDEFAAATHYTKTTTAADRIASFPVGKTHYTIFVTTTSGSVVGTRAYMLINNLPNNNLGSSGANSVCTGSQITFQIDQSATGILRNYPGTYYTVTWGDNNTNNYTHCQLLAAGGKVSHTYLSSSCGKVLADGQTNVFQVDLQAANAYCGSTGTRATSYARVATPPTNSIAPQPFGCTNTPITFTNTSYPGQDPNNTVGTCEFTAARYTWYVDGVPKETGYQLHQPFTHTFTTPGNHTVTVELENPPSSACGVTAAGIPICIQTKPEPKFDLSDPVVCAGTLTPINNTVIDNSCYTGNIYTWTITPDGSWPAASYASGTNANSKNPVFRFNSAGIYRIGLSVTDACGNVLSATEKRLVVNSAPTVNLQNDVSFCGLGAFNFNDAVGSPTRVHYEGTSDPSTATYNWTVTALDGQSAATFVNGTQQSNEQYPRINFTGYGRYRVTVQQTQNGACGASTLEEQVITIQQAPTVSAGNNVAICASDNTVNFAGSISDAAVVTAIQWTSSGSGTFTNGNTLTPTYTLNNADKQGGNITITLNVTTSLAGNCANIQRTLVLNITPTATVDAPATTRSVCSGSRFTHLITSAGLTSRGYTVAYSWTTAVTPGITGVGSSGSGATINDDPVNGSNTIPGTVTYTITPRIINGNGQPCVGEPYELKVTVNPLPVLTVPPVAPICSGQPVNLTLNSNLPGTRFTWTSSVISGIANGNTQQSTPVTTSPIPDVIINTSTTDAVIRYIITPISASGCTGTPAQVDVTINPAPSAANAGTDAQLCAVTTYALNGNTPLVGTGTWTETSGTVTFANANDAHTTVSGLVPGRNYQFTWTIQNACGISANAVQLRNDLATNGGAATATVATVCSGTGGNIQLTGQVGAVTTWQNSVDNGNTWIDINGTAGLATYVRPALTQTTMYRALVKSGSCLVLPSQPATVTVNAATPAAAAMPDQQPCNVSGISLTANAPAGFVGQWTQVGGPAATIVSPASANTDVTGLVGGNIYTFRWTIKGLPPCADTFDEVVINNLAPITNTIIPPAATVCSGATVNLTGSAPTGGNGIYIYLWERSLDNGTSWQTLAGQTSANATAVVTAPTVFRRSITSGSCIRVSNEVSVGIQAGISNNIITPTNNPICYNTNTGLINGSAPQGGGGSYSYTWERSTDGINFTVIPGANQQNYQPPALTATTTYRRIVSTVLCAGLPSTSNAVTITVNPDVHAAFTAVRYTDCAPFIITSQMVTAEFDANASEYNWYINNSTVPFGTGRTFPGYRIENEGETVTIRLEVKSNFGCVSFNDTKTFRTSQKVTASFTTNNITSGCGPTTITFTNTSTPQLPGTAYTWDFGDGTPISHDVSPTHTFQPTADGKETVYNVVLTPDGCAPVIATKAVTIHPLNPVAEIDPGQTTGCGPYAITVNNLSPGTNTKYTYYLLNPNGTIRQEITRTDKSSITFNAVNPSSVTVYTVYMKVENSCGRTTESRRIPLEIAPSGTTSSMGVRNNRGCAPLVVTFSNYSVGGTRYVFNITDANGVTTSVPTVSTADREQIFTTPGNYTVNVTAFNNCSPTGIPSANYTVTVYESPVANFSAPTTPGCKELNVQFTNLTTGSTDPHAFQYEWNFGDGATSTEFEPHHTFDYTRSPYTVTLKVKNNFDCNSTVTKTAYIIVNPPTFPEFTADPGFVTSIPNYHFQFNDRTTGNPVSWAWDFGDGQQSNNRNPSHTYADTGKYVVKLTTRSALGCLSTMQREVHVTGIPGQLYVPNAFMPSSGTDELRRFTVKGSGIRQWRLRIFDNWGQLVFETTKLNSRGEPVDFWDGTFRGQPVRQGVYAWEISASFINGQEWTGMSYKTSAPKRSGTVTLLR